MRRRYLAACALLALGAAPSVPSDDLRGLRVGASAAALPMEGFGRLRCRDGNKTELSAWSEWEKCPADADGRHAIRFGYDAGDTMVAGHPVELTAAFGDDGRLKELRIDTDPQARLFLRKKAFLLGLQARSRYGDEDWVCSEGTPDGTAEPVGGAFVRQSCRKTLPGKTIVVDRNLFRRPGTDLTAFVGESRVTVTAAP